MPEAIKQKLEAELRQLEAELRTEIPRELKKAVAMGDLSENAEYESARNRQDYVRARIASLRKRLADLSMIDVTRLPRDRAAYGSTVVLYDCDSGEEVTYKLVMAEDADVAKGRISTDRKSTRLNSSHVSISYAVFCLKKQQQDNPRIQV